MPDGQTVTGPIALIKVNGLTIGKIRTITATETFDNVPVKGLGDLSVQEYLMTGHMGTFNIDSFLIDLKSSGIRKLLNRSVVSPEEFQNTATLNRLGIDIYIYKKIPKTIDDTTGLVTAIDEKPIAILRRCFLDSGNFNVSTDQISMYNQTGKFLDPIIFVE